MQRAKGKRIHIFPMGISDRVINTVLELAKSTITHNIPLELKNPKKVNLAKKVLRKKKN